MDHPTQPSDETRAETRAAEEDEAQRAAGADRMPTQEEARLAEKHGEVDESVAEHEEEMMERGVEEKGEGRIP
jgi:hypothetical protein